MKALGGNLFNDDYPPVAFHFKVIFGITGVGGKLDSSFKEVSGISTKFETETVEEGGENRYVHTLPTYLKKENLVLKRGISAITSPLVIWCKQTMEADLALPILPQPIIIYLMDEKGLPLRGWSFANAWPVSWDVEGFDAQKNEVAIEKIELSYTYSNRLM